MLILTFPLPPGGKPLVVADPAGATAAAFMELGAAVVQEVAKLKLVPRSAVRSVVPRLLSRGKL